MQVLGPSASVRLDWTTYELDTIIILIQKVRKLKH